MLDFVDDLKDPSFRHQTTKMQATDNIYQVLVQLSLQYTNKEKIRKTEKAEPTFLHPFHSYQ